MAIIKRAKSLKDTYTLTTKTKKGKLKKTHLRIPLYHSLNEFERVCRKAIMIAFTLGPLTTEEYEEDNDTDPTKLTVKEFLRIKNAVKFFTRGRWIGLIEELRYSLYLAETEGVKIIADACNKRTNYKPKIEVDKRQEKTENTDNDFYMEL